jgi:protein-L-isoaspartate(D-aspartate) O-methyltransferase
MSPDLSKARAAMSAEARVDSARFERARRRMAQRLSDGGICDLRVLHAFDTVPRHLLVPEALREQAYSNSAIPIGNGQTISAPETVAAMTEALELTGKETVLEVGTGSAYQAALLGHLAERVISIERVPKLASQARSSLDRMGVTNVVVHLGDGSREAPYDAIVVTAGGPEVPAPLLDQLAVGGRLVGPFGSKDEQVLMRFRRKDSEKIEREVLGRCRFVDLIGEHGWAG